MNEAAVLDAVADAWTAASDVLRQRAALLRELTAPPMDETTDAGAVAKARAIHDQLGQRQAQILAVLEEFGEAGTNTGVISRRIGYDQPNVYITLRVLAGLGFVEKDETTNPHTYRLASLLR